MKNHKIESFEQMILMSASGADTDITGTDAADMLVSDADNQALNGLGGNDTIEGGLNSLISGGDGDDRIITKDGINTVDGGSGYDTLQLLSSDRADFHAIDRGFGIIEICSDTQRTFVIDVEAVQFADGVFTIDQLTGTDPGTGNNPPMIVDPANTHININENTTFVVDVNGTDLDGDTLTYSIKDSEDSSFFSIDPVTGELSFINAPDFENPLDGGADNTYDVTIVVSDGTDQTEITLWVTVDDVDEGGGNTPPEFTNITDDQMILVDEGTLAVVDVDGSDADGDTLTYSFSDGLGTPGSGVNEDTGSFNIDPNTGVITFKVAPDFENPGDADGNNEYLLTVVISDGTTARERDIIVKVQDVNEGGGNNAPVFTNVQEGEIVTVPENTTSVGDADASDADGDTLTYAITGGADSGLFSIDSATGVVSFIAAPDFEAPGDADGNNDYVLQLTVSDGKGGTDVKNVLIRVTDVGDTGGGNTAPVFTNVQEGEIVTVPENTTSVGDADASDADGDTLTYAITGGADAGRFTIDSATGVVSFIVSPDFEAPGDADGNNDYVLQLTVSDGKGGTDTKNVVIRVTDSNETADNVAPVFTNVQEGEIVTVPENTTSVGDADATDANGDTLTYAITGGADAGRFSINSATGVVSFIAAPDFEAPGDADGNNDYVLQLTVSDGKGGTDVKNVVIRVTDVGDGGTGNTAPVFTNVQEGEQVLVPENTTSVGDADASDADGDTLTYSITGGADSSLFSINSSTGVVSFLAAPDFEAPGDANGNNIYELQLTVADGNGGTDVKNVTVRVTDVGDGGTGNTAPVFTNVQEGEIVTVPENTTSVGDANASDADGDTLTYAITGGADAGRFTINSATGVVSFIAAPDFEAPGDADGNNDYVLQLTVSDGNGGTDVKNVVIRVTDVGDGGTGNTAPLFTNVQEGEQVLVPENTTSVGDADASDVDGDTLTYSITGGADSGLFSINSSTGVVSFLAAPDFEAPGDANGNNIYELQLTVADGNGGTDVKNVTVRVTDVGDGGTGNTAPVFTNVQEGEIVTVPENTTSVGDANASDADGDTLTYAITGGADAGRFTINSATGVVSFIAAPDFEAPGDADGNNDYVLQLTVSDGNGGTDIKNVVIRVTDVGDGGTGNTAPVFTNVQEGEQVLVPENTTSVGDADASDADGDTLTYSITGGADSSLFSINSSTGVVSFLAAPDFEAPGDANGNNIYELQLTVADGNGGTDVKNVTVRVTDVGDGGTGNTAPVFTNVQEGEIVTVPENTTSVGDANASDADGDTLTYAITGGADAGRFTINSSTGVVSFIAAPDFEAPSDADGNNLYQLTLQVSDGNGGVDTKNVTIRVTDVNDGSTGGNVAPFFTNIFQNESVAVAEGTTFVGDADAFDGNGDSLTFSIAGGADASQFVINSATGQLSFINTQDFENPGDSNGDNFFEVVLRVSDGSSFQDRTVFVQIDDVTEGGNQAPRFTNVQVGEFVYVNENTTFVGDANAADADGDSLTFSIAGGTDASLFTINSSTGVLSFINGQDFENPGDANGDNSFGVVIRVSDGTSYQDRLIWVELVNTAS